MLASALVAFALAGRPSPVRAPFEPVRVRFVRPADWRCRSRATCVECANAGDRASDVIVSDDDERTLSVPAGSAVSICPP